MFRTQILWSVLAVPLIAWTNQHKKNRARRWRAFCSCIYVFINFLGRWTNTAVGGKSVMVRVLVSAARSPDTSAKTCKHIGYQVLAFSGSQNIIFLEEVLSRTTFILRPLIPACSTAEPLKNFFRAWWRYQSRPHSTLLQPTTVASPNPCHIWSHKSSMLFNLLPVTSFPTTYSSDFILWSWVFHMGC